MKNIQVLIIIVLFLFSSSWGKSVDYKVDENSYEGFLLKNKSKAPTIILIHDWDGLDKYEKKRAQMLFDLGYSVFALDMFGKGVRPAEIKERKRLTGALYKDRKQMRKLMNGALKAAKNSGLNINNAIALGYCFGGTSVLEWAKSGTKLKGFVSFHGNLDVNPGDSYKKAQGKIVAYHGTADKAVSMQAFADLAILLEQENVPHEMITYSGAPHAFTKFGTERYRELADKKSWKHFTEFLTEVL